jgi:uncharacterized membrane protein
MDNRTLGQKLADIITEFSGSWSFLIIFAIVCITWISFNLFGIWSFDRAPYLILNLVLNLIVAIQSPLILLSQTRQNDNDRAHIKDLINRLDKIQNDINKLK